MGITKTGAVFFNTLGDGGGAPAIVRSTDEGASWEAVFDRHEITADPYMYVDYDTGRIFANDLIPPCHLISYSDDGDTWTTAPAAGCGYNEDHQTVFGGPPPEGGAKPSDYPNVIYLCSISDGISIASAGSACSKSLDGGVTFTPADDDCAARREGGVAPGMTIGASGKIAVYYHASRNSPWNGSELVGESDQMTWNGYITMTTRALAEKPIFYSATINDPKDPLWIGHCGPDPIRCGWGDFFDVVVSPKGEPWSVTVDLCGPESCAGDGEGVVGRLVGGPSLR